MPVSSLFRTARTLAARRTATVAALVVLGAAAGGCVPLMLGGAVGGALVATDRRPVGIQIEDEAIERRVNRVVADRFGLHPINVEVTSYNRRVLLTGEVPSEALKGEIERAAQSAENVREVVNDIGVGQSSSFGSRTNDTVVAGKVRTALLNERDLPAGIVKITTTRAQIYLMGRVTQAEADLAALVASRVSGVEKVVKVFEVLPVEEIRALSGARPTAMPDTPRR